MYPNSELAKLNIKDQTPAAGNSNTTTIIAINNSFQSPIHTSITSSVLSINPGIVAAIPEHVGPVQETVVSQRRSLKITGCEYRDSRDDLYN